MGFERLKGAIVPGFGQLAIGDEGVDFRALPIGTGGQILEFRRDGSTSGDHHA